MAADPFATLFPEIAEAERLERQRLEQQRLEQQRRGQGAGPAGLYFIARAVGGGPRDQQDTRPLPLTVATLGLALEACAPQAEVTVYDVRHQEILRRVFGTRSRPQKAFAEILRGLKGGT